MCHTKIGEENVTISMDELWDNLESLDADEYEDDFDPEKVVGDIKDKIDAIRYQILKWEKQADLIEEEMVKPFQKRVQSLRNKAEGLTNYVKSQMAAKGYDKLPGKVFCAAFQKSKPSLSVAYEADDSAYESYPEFVVRETTTRWDRKKLAEYLNQGNKLSFATLKPARSFRFRIINKGNEVDE